MSLARWRERETYSFQNAFRAAQASKPGLRRSCDMRCSSGSGRGKALVTSDRGKRRLEENLLWPLASETSAGRASKERAATVGLQRAARSSSSRAVQAGDCMHGERVWAVQWSCSRIVTIADLDKGRAVRKAMVVKAPGTKPSHSA